MSVDPRPAKRSASGPGELLEEALPRLRGVLRRYAIPVEDAEDLIQEVCLHFLRKRERVVEPRTWLDGALRKECLMYWRRRRRRLYDAIDQELLELAADPARDAAEQRLFRRELHDAMGRLRDRCRSLLSLRYGLDVDRRSVAERLGCAATSVDKLTRRCLNALGRTLLAPVRRAVGG